MSEKITEYMVLVGDRVEKGEEDGYHELGAGVDLANQVKEAILDYWQPFGAPWGSEKRMWQAMVKYEQG